MHDLHAYIELRYSPAKQLYLHTSQRIESLSILPNYSDIEWPIKILGKNVKLNK